MSRLSDFTDKLDRLTLRLEQLAKCRIEAAKIPELERECDEVRKALTEDLHRLDVADSGNAGWLRRVIQLLSELRKASTEAGIEIGMRKVSQPTATADVSTSLGSWRYSPPQHESQG